MTHPDLSRPEFQSPETLPGPLRRYHTLLRDPALREQFLAGKSFGGSRAGAVLGLSRWGSAASVYDAIYGIAVEDPSQSPVMRRGNILEPVIIQELREAGLYRDIMPQPGRRRSSTMPFLHGTPDAYAVDHDTASRGILEVKCVNREVLAEMIANGADPNYIAQVLTYYMIAPEAEWAHLIVFSPDRWEWVRFNIPRHEPTMREMERLFRVFWDRVEAMDRPAGWPAPIPSLPIVRNGPPTARREDQEWIDAVTELRHAREELALAEHRKEMAETVVKRMMGDLTNVRWPGGSISWSEYARTGFDLARFREEHPELAAEYARSTWVRAFRPTFKD